MSEKLLRFILLRELKTIRLVCKSAQCGAITELPIDFLESRFRRDSCPVCNAPLNVMTEQDANYLEWLAKIIVKLRTAPVRTVMRAWTRSVESEP